MARTYTPSPNEMSAAHIDRAAKEGRPPKVISDVATQANHLSLSRDDPAEQRRAALSVSDLTLSHPCQLDPANGVTACSHPGHAEDVEVVRDLLDAFGLLDALTDAAGPDDTWLTTAQAARALGISTTSVRKRVTAGRLRGARVGRIPTLRIDPDQVRRLAAAAEKEGTK